ncbi:hypothetical protein [Tritonibacter mobilis]|uniref:hypothetical protein n=1 Tax=Tritonibacter mobilis TaxID=379347 RepID=UPI003A5BC7F9
MDLDGLFGWLSGFEGGLSFFVIPVSSNEAAFDWATFLSTSIVAVTTLVAAYGTFWLTRRWERKKICDASEDKNSERALSGYLKLHQWANLVANIDLHISNCFTEAYNHDFLTSDASLMVGPAVGVFSAPEKLTSDEYSFLLTKENYELVNGVLLLEQRGANLLCLLDEYSKLRVETEAWVTSLPGFRSTFDGPMANQMFPVQYAAAFEQRVGQLNRIVAGIVEATAVDVPMSEEIVAEFINAARLRFSDRFPSINFGTNPNVSSRLSAQFDLFSQVAEVPLYLGMCSTLRSDRTFDKVWLGNQVWSSEKVSMSPRQRLRAATILRPEWILRPSPLPPPPTSATSHQS